MPHTAHYGSYGDTPAKAKKNVRRSDAARGAYYKNITGMQWGDAKNYDLCVNSEAGVEAAADVICNFIKSKS
ncbi:MAG: cytidylate kinase-like family protein [Clostridia bacterium]|nr:cytidylate kinase-like family protein [Clostridia bacterium]